MNGWFVAAAAVSVVAFGIHFFLGGRDTARPLLAASDIEPTAKFTHYFGWHIISIILVAMPVGFIMAAFRIESRALAWMMTALAVSFAIWNLALIAWKYRYPWRLPQWTLFLPISALGAIGLIV
ncbi:MAG: hypothetical protein HYY84_13080 [Deltaproteobacteria bacterium]|nr:hypothetical protein [Deltaproteobacteria bacterium]